MNYLLPHEYLPHEAPMLLLEEVISVSDSAAHCRVTINPQGVLAPFLSEDGRLANWFAVELVAQTVGVWSGWHSMQEGKEKIQLGMLLGARDFVFQLSEFPADSVLDITVDLLMRDETLGSFNGAVCINGQTVANGRINTYQPSDEELSTLFT